VQGSKTVHFDFSGIYFPDEESDRDAGLLAACSSTPGIDRSAARRKPGDFALVRNGRIPEHFFGCNSIQGG